MPDVDFDTSVKLAVYQITADTGSIPNAVSVARAIGSPEKAVVSAFIRLRQKRLLVPEPNDSGRIRMAPPFSGVATSFPVDSRGRRYYANCIWDAYGVVAALDADAIIPAQDGFTGEPLVLEVRGRRPVLHSYVAHFAVPAAKWWEDIVFT
jgi:Alkylmercury lyase